MLPRPRPLRPSPRAPSPSPRPIPSGPAPSSASNAEAARRRRRTCGASQRRRDPAGVWGFSGARLRSLPSGTRGGRPAPPPGKMALHFQVSALCTAGPRSAAPGTRRDAEVWRLRAEDGGGGRRASDRRLGAPAPAPAPAGDSGTGLGCPPRARARARGGDGPCPGVAGGGAGARFGARSSGEVRMLRIRCAVARTSCAGHGAKGCFGGAQAGGSLAGPDQPSRRVAGRSSIASLHTVGMQFERGPGPPEGTAAAVGFLIGYIGRGLYL